LAFLGRAKFQNAEPWISLSRCLTSYVKLVSCSAAKRTREAQGRAVQMAAGAVAPPLPKLRNASAMGYLSVMEVEKTVGFA
jgi:hypothetical protein